MAKHSPLEKTLRIVALGMEERALKTLDAVFRGPGLGCYQLVKDQSADVAIVDLDGMQGIQLLEDFRRHHPQTPILVLSVHRQAIDNTFFIKKPLQINMLFEGLEKIVQGLQSSTSSAQLTDNKASSKESESLTTAERLCGSLPDVDPLDPIAISKVYYEPKNYLQGILEKSLAIGKQQKTGIVISGFAELIILLPETNQAFCPLKDHELRAICLMPIQHRLINTILINQTDKTFYAQIQKNMIQSQPLDQFLWKISLWTSHGRIPVGIDLNKPVYLYRWPNLTRLLLTPHALRIAALWKKCPYSLIDTAHALNIPQRYVFTFFAAVHSLQLVRFVEESAMPMQPVTEKHPKRELFQKILSKILGGGLLGYRKVQNESV